MLTVNDLMTINPYSVSPDASLREVLVFMKSEECRQIPVVEENNELVGLVTDRDVRLAMQSPLILSDKWINDSVLDNISVSSCMTSTPITVTPDTLVSEAAEMLVTYKFGALPVVDNNQLVGIITISDFLNHFYESEKPKIIVNI